MALVAAKCTQCGANLQIENTQEAAVCPHCHTPFITETAINNYNTFNQNNYNINSAEIHVHNEGKDLEKLLQDAEILMSQVRDYEKAWKIYESVTQNVPNDYRGWWGLLRHYLHKAAGKVNLQDAQAMFNQALQVAPAQVKPRIMSAWQSYSSQAYNLKQQLEANQKEILRESNNSTVLSQRTGTAVSLIIAGILITFFGFVFSWILPIFPILLIGIALIGLGVYYQVRTKSIENTNGPDGEQLQRQRAILQKNSVALDHQFGDMRL